MKRAVIALVVCCLALTVATADDRWKDTPTACPATTNSQTHPDGYPTCGYNQDTGSVYFYDWAGNGGAPDPDDRREHDQDFDSTVDGGFVVDCYDIDGSPEGGSEPLCNRGTGGYGSGQFWCDTINSCDTNHRETRCETFAADGDSAATCTRFCQDGRISCEFDGGGTVGESTPYDEVDNPGGGDACEIDVLTTPYNENSFNGNIGDPSTSPDAFVVDDSCSPTCQTGHYNNDGDVQNGCEIQQGESCTISGVNGTYDCSYAGSAGDADSCTCVPGRSNFTTGRKSTYLTSDPLLWGQNVGDGELINVTNEQGDGFIVNNNGTTNMIVNGTDQTIVQGLGDVLRTGDDARQQNITNVSSLDVTRSATVGGLNSAATGPNGSLAVGWYARAFGGSGSTALGSQVTANNTTAIAIGDNATATGTNAIALGTDVLASATNSTAIGSNIDNSQPSSFALGFDDNKLLEADSSGLTVKNPTPSDPALDSQGDVSLNDNNLNDVSCIGDRC